MKVLRMILTQSSANYRREETETNKMTYPLPPVSMIIGAVHAACNFTEYHPMDISVQGKFKSMHREAYTDYCFLNSTMNDRGILVKMKSDSFLNAGFTKVAEAKKSMGNDFRKGITIKVYNQELLDEYRELKDLSDKVNDFNKERVKPVLEMIKKRKKTIAQKKKNFKDDNLKYEKIVLREKQIKSLEKTIKERLKKYVTENIDIPYSKFKSLTTSLKYYEILDDIKLIIHIKADEKLLNTILENVYNIKSIGRSEDFIDVKDARLVELKKCDDEVYSEYSAYLNYDDVINERIYLKSSNSINKGGTKYYINKNYVYEDEEKKLTRNFNKCKVIYSSGYGICEDSPNVFLDTDDYIVNFL